MSKILSHTNYTTMKETTKQFLQKNNITAFPVKIKLTETNEIKYGEKKIKKEIEITNINLDRTLTDKPWKFCDCLICKEVGVEVIIFRGNNRNRRRGFHNLWVYKKHLKNLNIK